jgi:hypothetical protein
MDSWIPSNHSCTILKAYWRSSEMVSGNLSLIRKAISFAYPIVYQPYSLLPHIISSTTKLHSWGNRTPHAASCWPHTAPDCLLQAWPSLPHYPAWYWPTHKLCSQSNAVQQLLLLRRKRYWQRPPRCLGKLPSAVLLCSNSFCVCVWPHLAEQLQSNYL